MSENMSGTHTERNLFLAFVGESQARNRYSYFAGAARKEGLMQIASIFEETAEQEKEHAKRFLRLMEGGSEDVEVAATFPVVQIGSTIENLRAAASGEEYEWKNLYPAFAEQAREEGFEAVALAFEAISVAEQQHGKRYTDLADNLDEGRVFKRGTTVVWRCRNCGYLHEAEEAAEVCPACLHPRAYFELLGENW